METLSCNIRTAEGLQYGNAIMLFTDNKYFLFALETNFQIIFKQTILNVYKNMQIAEI